MTREEVLTRIKDVESDYENFVEEDGTFDSPYSREAVFNGASWILQEYAESKKIEYVGYFRTKFEKNREFSQIGSHPYLDLMKEKRNLYVFMSAQDDQDVFVCLKYVYDKTHDEGLTPEVLKKEIFEVNQWGIIFARY